MKRIDLSVIVACYNIQDYVRDCLTSLAKTNFPKGNFEVLMVDDGSTDRTSQILDEFDQKYPEFHALHKPNGGLSDARNYGLDRANGKYIAFVDGDDVVPPNAYPDLVYTAEAHRSQVVIGFVKRFNNLKSEGSSLHKLSVKNDKFNTNLKATPSLLYDTTAWNKLFLKSFLNHHHFRFIPRILYEDIPFVLNVYLHSNRISYIKNVVYCWRKRSQSITQSRGALSNFKSRIHSLNLCRQEFFKAGYRYPDPLIKAFQKKVLRIDIKIFLSNIGDTEDFYAYQVQELVYKFMRDWHLLNAPCLKELPMKTQLLYYAVKRGNFPLLKRFSYLPNSQLGRLKPHRFSKHYHYACPGVPKRVLQQLNPRDNVMSLSQKMNRFKIDEGRHLVSGSGMFRIKHVQLFKKKFSNSNYRERLLACLVNLTNHRSCPIRFNRRKTLAYKRIFRPKTSWTNARYNFAFNYRTAVHKLGLGDWMIRVKDVIDNKYWVVGYLGRPKQAGKVENSPVSVDQVTITGDFNTNWHLVFRARSQKLIGSDDVDWLCDPEVRDGRVCFTAGLVNATETVPWVIFNEVDHLTGRVTPVGDHYQISFSLHDWPRDRFQQTYQLWLVHRRTGKVIPYLFRGGHAFIVKHAGPRQQVLVTYNDRFLRLGFQYRQLLVKNYRLVDHRHSLRVVAQIEMPYHYQHWQFNHLKVELLSASRRYRYLLTTGQHQVKYVHHQLIFTVPLLNWNAKQLMVLKGRYRFIAYLPANDQQVIETGFVLPKKLAMETTRTLPIKTKDVVRYKITSSKNDKLKLKVKQPRRGLERSRSFRALSYSILYPLMRLLPLRNTMVFDCYWAQQFSSNERAIYEYVRAHDPKIKLVWFFRNPQTPIDGKGVRVKVNSLKYWYYFATAKYLFQNANLPDRYFKRPGQIEVETLHGTFLKHMGFDEPYFRTNRWNQGKFIRRIRRWDYMVVPSEYMRRVASHAFDYHQKIIPAGFPRNDELSFHNNSSYVNAIKRKLNIPLNKKVVLYAPTFRNHAGFDFVLNLKRLKRALDPNYVFLVRLHYFVAHAGDFYDYPGFVYDVSDYPNINDLYLISDVLVTDYSSVMFDYAYLKRPIIFYAYDKQHYLDDRYRGTYLDYESSMPGPIVTDETALIKMLKSLSQVRRDYHDRIVEFANRFAQYGRKGDATKRVVDTVLGTRKDQLDQQPDRHVIFNKFWHWFRIKNFRSALLDYLSRVLPKRNLMIFNSYFGTQYSGDPKAIYLYVKKHAPQYRLYWNVAPEAADFFKRHHIPYMIRGHYRGIVKQARAKYWITNSCRPYHRKFYHQEIPNGTVVLQTWHGTPLKPVGADVGLIANPSNNAINYHKQMYLADRRWNYLVTSSPYAAKVMRRAFRQPASHMMLTGSPRDDALVNATPQRATRVKRRLGIRPGQKVVLYAPTWRDNHFIRNGEYVARLHLDLDQFRRHYGRRVVVLVRSDYRIASRLDLSRYRDVALNVSNYHDVNDLYLISDVMITDYSSAMFDYAILKRPMIFYDYDLREFLSRTRGLYFDFRKVAPGPVVTKTEQVIEQLDRVFDGNWRLSNRYRRFLKRFTSWADGKASGRVVHQLLSGQNVIRRNLTRTQLRLPKLVQLKDGAAMWRAKKSFTNVADVNFDRNYDSDGRHFTVIKGMQLHSASFDQPIGMRFALISDSQVHCPVWVNVDDLVLK